MDRPEPTLPDKLYFRIGEVADLVGVDAHVLRYWETEFSVEPHRSTAGQRLYRRLEIARFLRIRNLLHDEGYTIAGARKILDEGTEHPPSVEPDRIREALGRLDRARASLRTLRDEVAPKG